MGPDWCNVEKRVFLLYVFEKIMFRGRQKSQKSLRPQKSNSSKLVRFFRKIYHSTRLDERFSNLFPDLKNLYAFKSYDWNTDFIVTAKILNSNGQLWIQYFDHNFWTRKDFLDLKTDLKSARRDASNGISYEGIGPTLENSIFQVVGNFRILFPENPTSSVYNS